MIYSMFIYSAKSGVLIWDKTFEEISSGKVELFSSFFSAIQSFVQEMILKGSSELKNIELSDYIISFHPITELGIDLVVIIDSKDEKRLAKLFDLVNDILLEHSVLFEMNDGNRRQFGILNRPITEAVYSIKGLKTGNKSKLVQQFEEIEEIAEEDLNTNDEIDACLQTRERILEKYHKERTLLNKLDLINKAIELDMLINDQDKYSADARIKKKVENEIKDTKMKIDYFLKHTKETLAKTVESSSSRHVKDMDLRDSYIAFYSFSNKLKLLGKTQAANIYSNLAKSLIEKETMDEAELKETVTYILKLPDDISYYTDS